MRQVETSYLRKKSADYQYDASASPETLAANYQIRMNEEWGDTNQADLRKYVIRAHGQDGNYEIYKYGLDADKRQGTISYPGGSYDYSGFSPAQRKWHRTRTFIGLKMQTAGTGATRR